MLEEFQFYGHWLFTLGLISSHGGNLSISDGEKIIITRRDSMLGRLKAEDLVEVSLKEKTSEDRRASRELVVHRAIYLNSPARAIIHAHPPLAVALSLRANEIVPLDAEAKKVLPRIPVVEVKEAIGSEEVAAAVSPLFKEVPVVLVKGHGSFAAGPTLEAAFYATTVLEMASRIILGDYLLSDYPQS